MVFVLSLAHTTLAIFPACLVVNFIVIWFCFFACDHTQQHLFKHFAACFFNWGQHSFLCLCFVPTSFSALDGFGSRSLAEILGCKLCELWGACLCVVLCRVPFSGPTFFRSGADPVGSSSFACCRAAITGPHSNTSPCLACSLALSLSFSLPGSAPLPLLLPLFLHLFFSLFFSSLSSSFFKKYFFVFFLFFDSAWRCGLVDY